VLVLIILIVFGVGVIARASVVLLRDRQATGVLKVREALYRTRSTTVSAPVPAKRPPEADE
jgi:hypothetical protein